MPSSACRAELLLTGATTLIPPEPEDTWKVIHELCIPAETLLINLHTSGK